MEMNRLKIMSLVIITWVTIGVITYIAHLIRKRREIERNKRRSKRLLKKIVSDRQYQIKYKDRWLR